MKTLIHAFIVASIINSAYLIGVPLITECLAAGALPPLPISDFVEVSTLEVNYLGCATRR